MTIQNFFNDSDAVLRITERLLRDEIYYNQTSLLINPAFFNLNSWDVYECANNLFDEDDEPKEPLEWWLVSEYLYKELTSINEVTLETDFGHYWGRTTSGQHIYLDGVLQQIARIIDKR